jgi:dCMP deaminase
MLQAKVAAVYYLHDWSHPNPAHKAEYERLQAGFPQGIRKIEMDDPEESWATAPRPKADATKQPPMSGDQHGGQDL